MDLKIIIKTAAPFATEANIDKYIPFLNDLMLKYGINTPLRQRHFLAQILHESGNFSFVKENLNYSADGLMKTFPKYFATKYLAEMYARQPEKIANRVYANRMGNDSEASREPSKFIGRGLIQITGKNNYTAVSKDLFGDNRLLDHPEILEQPEYATESACWFWKTNNISVLADKDDINAVTRRINGGLNGISERINYYNKLVINN